MPMERALLWFWPGAFIHVLVGPLEFGPIMNAVLSKIHYSNLFLRFGMRTWEERRMSPRPHVSVFVWKRNFFVADTASVYTYPMKTVTENATFWKRSPEWNLFENAIFVFPCGQGKTELFENDDVSVLDPVYPRERKWRDMVILGFCFV